MKKKNNKGFSLIELIIAIAILVILTGLLAPQFMRYMEKAREAKDMQSLDTVYGATQTALANEAAYKDVNENADLATIMTTGMTLENIVSRSKETITGDTTKPKSPFCAELVEILGGSEDAKLWSSKAVTDAGKSAAVYVLLEPKTFRVSVWIGNVTTGGTVTEANAISTKTLTVSGKPVTTVGNTFFISK